MVTIECGVYHVIMNGLCVCHIFTFESRNFHYPNDQEIVMLILHQNNNCESRTWTLKICKTVFYFEFGKHYVVKLNLPSGMHILRGGGGVVVKRKSHVSVSRCDVCVVLFVRLFWTQFIGISPLQYTIPKYQECSDSVSNFKFKTFETEKPKIQNLNLHWELFGWTLKEFDGKLARHTMLFLNLGEIYRFKTE